MNTPRSHRRGRTYLAIAAVLALAAGAAGLAIWLNSGSGGGDPDGEGDATAVDPLSVSALPEEERVYLWDTEHHGTLMRAYAFPRFAAALKKSDAAALTALCAETFHAQWPVDPAEVALSTSELSVARQTTNADQLEELSRDQFVERMMEIRSRLNADAQVKVALMAFAPADREDLSGRWNGSFRVRMYGENEEGGPVEIYLYMTATIDNPSSEFLPTGAWLVDCRLERIKDALSASPLMADVTEEWGFDRQSLHNNWDYTEVAELQVTPGGVFVFDFNKDGNLDVLVTDVKLPFGFALYQGDGRSFRDVTADLGFQETRVTLTAVVDLDGDGWEDIIFDPGAAIYRNEGGQKFSEVSYRSNLFTFISANEQKTGGGLSLVDFDRDGMMDLYMYRASSKVTEGSWVDGKIGDNYQNQLLRNLGDWNFEDVTEQTGTNGGLRSTFATVWLDANNDRWPDAYVINEFGNGVLLLNQEGKTFESHSLVDGPGDFGSMGLTCGDYDNDGNIDLYVASMYSKSGNRVIGNLRQDAYEELVMQKLRRMVKGSQLYRNLGDLQVEKKGAAFDVDSIGWAYGASMVDLNNDGFLDLFATAGFISRDRTKPDG